MKTMSTTQLSGMDSQIANIFVDKLQHRLDKQLAGVILYGSRARAESEPDSDMDFVVLLADATIALQKEIRYMAADVWLECGVYISTRVWGLDYWQRLREMNTLLYQNIQRDGVDLLTIGV